MYFFESQVLQRTDQREGRVEHDGRLDRFVGILERVTHVDDACIHVYTIADTDHCHESREADDDRLNDIVEPGVVALFYYRRTSAEYEKGCQQRDAEERDIPILHSGLAEDAQHVVVVLKLGEHAASSAAVGEAEIDHVHAIRNQTEHVRNPVAPLDGPAITLERTPCFGPGEKGQQQVERIGEQYRRTIEHRTAQTQLHHVGERNV